MNTTQIVLIQKVQTYLFSKKDACISAFKMLAQKLETEPMDLVGITFGYENIEVYARKSGKDQYWTMFFGVLSQGELDEITSYDFDDNDPKEDYQYYQVFLEIVRKMVTGWMVDCFYGSETSKSITLPIYYKDSIDGMEILRLNDLEIFHETTEWETFIKNNSKRRLELFRIT